MIVVDVETGGLDPLHSELLSIGAVDYEDQGNIFYVEMKPIGEMEMNPLALKINGYNPDTWNNELESDAMKSFHDWVSKIPDKVLAGHNPTFDLSFCNNHFGWNGLERPFSYRTVDLHSIAYSRLGKSLSADKIYEKLGMSTEPKPHNALTGAKYETQAFNILCHL